MLKKTIMCCMAIVAVNVHAATGYYVTIINNINSDIVFDHFQGKCWEMDSQLSKYDPLIIKAHDTQRFYAEQDDSFLNCAHKDSQLQFNAHLANNPKFQYKLTIEHKRGDNHSTWFSEPGGGRYNISRGGKQYDFRINVKEQICEAGGDNSRANCLLSD